MNISFAEMYGDLSLIIPEVVLFIFACLVLAMGAFGKRAAGTMAAWSFIGLVITTVLLITSGRGQAFGIMFIADDFALAFKLIILVAAMFTVASSIDTANKFPAHRGEYFGVVLLSAVGMMFMVSAGELLSMYVALELATVSLFVLAAYKKFDTKSAEAGLKYVILGAISSAVMLYGIALMYGLTGSLEYGEIKDALLQLRFSAGEFPRGFFVAAVLLIAGFGFKLSLVPFHMWAPDVYEGAPTPITAYLSTASKAAGLAVFLRVFFGGLIIAQTEWLMILAALAALAMIVGNITAVVQKNIKRMLAYSSIAHIGYILVAVVATNAAGVSAMTFYMIAYLFANMGAFIVAIVVAQKTGSDLIMDYSGLSKRSPMLAGYMLIFLLSLTGIPPLAGFVGKYYVFMAAIGQGYMWLVLVALLTSVIALYYYAYVMWRMYFAKEGDYPTDPVPFPALYKIILSVAVLAILIIGVYPGPFLDFALTAAQSFLP
jgi:NADH-quinone oxidoreductase subunit N